MFDIAFVSGSARFRRLADSGLIWRLRAGVSGQVVWQPIPQIGAVLVVEVEVVVLAVVAVALHAVMVVHVVVVMVLTVDVVVVPVG